MKKLFTFLFLIVISQFSYSQDFLQTLAQETCECLSNKNSEGLNQKEKEMQMGVCMLEGIGRHKKEFDVYRDGKSFDEIDLEKFGEEVGVYMATICPVLILDYADPSYFQDETAAAVEVELGKIKSMEKKQFNFVNLEVSDGSVLKFLWLWDFEGSELLIKNQFKEKWINIFYTIIPLYDPERKTYVNYKVIEGIELGE